MYKPICRFAVCFILCAWVSAASAGLVAITASSFSAPVGATVTSAFLGVTPFDPALGTLDSVNVTLNGQIVVEGITTPHRAPTPEQSLQPYAYQITVTQDFDGFLGKYFDFDTDALFTLPGLALGAGETFSLSTFFNYGFTFNSTTDLIGFAIPSFSTSPGTLVPPISVSGTRSGFLETIVPLDQISLVEMVDALSPIPVFATAISTDGSLIVQYNYTPAAVTVPEPGTFTLLGIAFVALGFGRRKRAS